MPPQEKVCVKTNHGEVVVVVLGDRQKPVAITYHDVGANCELCLMPQHTRNESSEFLSISLANSYMV